MKRILGRYPRLKSRLLTLYFGAYRYARNPRLMVDQLVFGDYSECGETKKIRQLLSDGSNRFLVEVGANDGKNGDAAYGLFLDGWRGLMIEPATKTFDRLCGNMRRFPGVHCLNCAISNVDGSTRLWHGKEDPTGNLATISTEQSAWFDKVRSESYEIVESRRLTEVLNSNGVPNKFDLLIIDAEGMDLEVLASLDFTQYRPHLIISEEYEPKREAKYFLLKTMGYKMECQLGSNTFWIMVRNDAIN